MENRIIELKVCGMRDHRNILEVALLGPQYMGFIFYSKSPRFVGDDFMIPQNFPDQTKKVGVFVNEKNEVILEKVKMHDLQYVQLHGEESSEQCRLLKKSVGVIKVFSVDEKMDFSVTGSYNDSVDFFLFDTKGKYYGGNAETFNWEILTSYDQKVPFFLSGGISVENTHKIQHLSKMNLQAIDINSGVENLPALKDVSKIKTIKSILYSKTPNE